MGAINVVNLKRSLKMFFKQHGRQPTNKEFIDMIHGEVMRKEK